MVGDKRALGISFSRCSKLPRERSLRGAGTCEHAISACRTSAPRYFLLQFNSLVPIIDRQVATGYCARTDMQDIAFVLC